MFVGVNLVGPEPPADQSLNRLRRDDIEEGKLFILGGEFASPLILRQCHVMFQFVVDQVRVRDHKVTGSATMVPLSLRD